MRTISVYEFRNNLASYLDEVTKGENCLIISRFNNPLVVIKPYKEDACRALKAENYFGFLGKGESGSTYINKLRRSKKEKIHIEALRNKNYG